MAELISSMVDELALLKERGRYRALRDLETPSGVEISIGGKSYLNFSSNDYLGLASSERLINRVPSLAKRWGIGAGASRLICGNMEVHTELEERIAAFKGCERALVFSAGYMANLGIVATLSGPGVTFFSDELNHASIIDGCRLGRSEVKVYRHGNMDHLEELLSHDRSPDRIIITDGVFSMDGDIAPLPELCLLKEKYGALLVVDDAHATGVIGRGGRGTASHFGLTEKVDIHMGTFSKAFGTYGAYICGSETIREYFINRCRPFIFNTGIPPLVAALTVESLQIIESSPELLERLNENIDCFTAALRDEGLEVDSKTPIIPVIVGTDRETVDISHRLMDEGYFIYGVRPPTVPEGTARLRITVSAAHTREQVKECGKRVGELITGRG